MYIFNESLTLSFELTVKGSTNILRLWLIEKGTVKIKIKQITKPSIEIYRII